MLIYFSVEMDSDVQEQTDVKQLDFLDDDDESLQSITASK